jgi:hypothetical protein
MFIAQLRAQGATEEQAQDRAAAQLQVLLRSRGIGGMRGAVLAQGVAHEAGLDLQKRLMGVGVQGLNAQQALLTIGQQLNAEVNQLGARQNALWGAVEALKRETLNRRRGGLPIR